MLICSVFKPLSLIYSHNNPVASSIPIILLSYLSKLSKTTWLGQDMKQKIKDNYRFKQKL